MERRRLAGWPGGVLAAGSGCVMTDFDSLCTPEQLLDRVRKFG
jgi:hypothetical protein